LTSAQHLRRARSFRRHRHGLTLVELMISLSISSALLVALGAAFHAVTRTVEINDSYFRCTQAARVALGQITTEIRRADAVQVSIAGDILQVIRPADQLSPNEIYRQFSYDAAGGRLTLQVFFAGNTSSPVYELATHVSACSFGSRDAVHSPGPCIPITITCSAGGNSVTLTGAATPRHEVLSRSDPH
jgi:prepilin-type N-terminal cleavage/methylation domain-containing protein